MKNMTEFMSHHALKLFTGKQTDAAPGNTYNRILWGMACRERVDAFIFHHVHGRSRDARCNCHLFYSIKNFPFFEVGGARVYGSAIKGFGYRLAATAQLDVFEQTSSDDHPDDQYRYGADQMPIE